MKASEADNQLCCEKMVRLPSAPHFDYLGMGDDPDLPSAYEKKGDMITQRHRQAGQSHT